MMYPGHTNPDINVTPHQFSPLGEESAAAFKNAFHCNFYTLTVGKLRTSCCWSLLRLL